MKSIALFEGFLKCCKDYEIVDDNIVITNGTDTLTIFKPSYLDKNNYIFIEQ